MQRSHLIQDTVGTHRHRGCVPRAFTLVELLVVVGIIGVLLGLTLTSITTFRTAADKTACASNLRQIGIAVIAFAGDHRGKFPPNNSASCSYWPYIFGDWGNSDSNSTFASTSDFYANYLKESRNVYYCRAGLRWQTAPGSSMGDVSESYKTFPKRNTATSQWIVCTNYCYFAGTNEAGTNDRGGPRSLQLAKPNDTILADVMRFNSAAPYITGTLRWNHFGKNYRSGSNSLGENSGGNLFKADGHMSWIGGVATSLANRRLMRGDNTRSYCVE
jgi:prepilin-type N-terminal cleavage/methylation domain-containing protein